ncbi:hypothetical protein [Algoriphagus formosus]|uniref:DUF5675 domain-containing protein n=1 Tax=Algoriphagus formosus TaxID=2007308 RepID=A0A4R5USF8_9BACT|nr:hypothetical protein [Algoriphagus aquimaris]TDK42049.1 hypothetical protein E1898_18935 [Algoriphagus aquimaris]
MRLLLKRRYSPQNTLGALYLGPKKLCLIREAPKGCFDPSRYCLEEGCYEIEPEHEEEKGWYIRVGKEGSIIPKTAPHSPGIFELCPVTNFRKDGTPMFTRLAFLKLMDFLTPFWERQEVIELQIVSYGIPYQLESCLSPSYC